MLASSTEYVVPNQCLLLRGGLFWVEFFSLGRMRGIDIQNFLYSRLINYFQNSKGRKNLLHPWLIFSFIRDNLDWREVCWLPKLPGQASGSKISVKSSSCPRGRWKSAKISPEKHWLGVLITLDTQLPSPWPSPMSTQSFKAWGLCELCATGDNGPTHTRETSFPQSQPGSCVASQWLPSPRPNLEPSANTVPVDLMGSLRRLRTYSLALVLSSWLTGSCTVFVNHEFDKLDILFCQQFYIFGGSTQKIGREFCFYPDPPGLRLNPNLTLSQLMSTHWILIPIGHPPL